MGCTGSKFLVCEDCHGLSTLPCPDCDGTGRMKSLVFVPLDNTRVFTAASCHSCTKTGKVHCGSCIGIGAMRCADCRGLGHIKCDCGVTSGYAKEQL